MQRAGILQQPKFHGVPRLIKQKPTAVRAIFKSPADQLSGEKNDAGGDNEVGDSDVKLIGFLTKAYSAMNLTQHRFKGDADDNGIDINVSNNLGEDGGTAQSADEEGMILYQVMPFFCLFFLSIKTDIVEGSNSHKSIRAY